MTRQKRDAAATRQRLLEAAEKVFVEKGFDGARVDEIAETATVNKRMMYLYFGSKEAMYEHVIREQFRRFVAATRLSSTPDETPVQQAERIIRTYYYYLAANPGFVRLLGWETLHLGAREGRALDALASRGVPALEAILKSGVEKGLFRPDVDIRRLIMSVSGLCLAVFNRKQGLAGLWNENLSDPKVLEDTLQHILKLVFHGVTLPAAR
jgi:TetR/AcrR family transcriptional regulator